MGEDEGMGVAWSYVKGYPATMNESSGCRPALSQSNHWSVVKTIFRVVEKMRAR